MAPRFGRTALVALVLCALAGPLHAMPAAAAAAADRTSCPVPDPATPKRQVRAEWIASVTNIDWPSRAGLPAAEQQAELLRWQDGAVARGFNTVMLQVRPTADAFWPSPLVPWSRWLTGTQGQDPGYDPRLPRRTGATWSCTRGSTRTGWP